MKDGYFFEMAFQGFTFGHNNNDWNPIHLDEHCICFEVPHGKGILFLCKNGLFFLTIFPIPSP